MYNVANVFTVFDMMSYKISKMNLTHFRGHALGQSMGAKVYTSYVGDGANRKLTQQTLDEELVFYDSSTADRGVCGAIANNPCCMGHYYKFTSERVVHSEWSMVEWPCDHCYGMCCCHIPCGRTVDFFDADLIVDVQAKQDLMQLCRNEGNLIVHRLRGDQDKSQTEYVIRDVPEVYTLFDDLSYDLARLDLSAYAENAIGHQMAG